MEQVEGAGLAVVAGNLAGLAGLAVLVGSQHTERTAQGENLVRGTSRGVRHKAAAGNHPSQEDPHDPIPQEEPEGRMVGIVGDDQKEEHLEVKVLAAGAQKEDLVVDVVEKLGLEVGDEIRSVNEPGQQIASSSFQWGRLYAACRSEGRQRKSPHGFALSETMS